MSYDVLTIPVFYKQAKRLIKKFPSLRNDLAALISELEAKPIKGTPLGNNFYKIRLSIASKSKGKSGSARVITFVKIIRTTVYLATIYDKSEAETVTLSELERIFAQLPEG